MILLIITDRHMRKKLPVEGLPLCCCIFSGFGDVLFHVLAKILGDCPSDLKFAFYGILNRKILDPLDN